MLWLILSLSARAETFTLDNGATVVGLLADYNMRGSCQISVSDGPYSGAILTVPCERIVRFERDTAAAPAPAPAPPAPAAVIVEVPEPAPEPIVEEVVVTEPEPEPIPLAQPVDAPFATEDAHAAAPEEAAVASRAPAPAPAPVPAPAPADDGGLWAEEAPAQAAAAEPPAEEAARPTVGGVVLPQLPNLRMMRRPAEGDGGSEGEL